MGTMRGSLVKLLVLLFLLPWPAAADERPAVGVSLPLSGMAAGYGTAFRNGLALYQEQHPELSAAVNFIFDDHQYDGAKVASSVRKLTTIDKVRFLLVWGAMPSDVAAPLAAQLNTPLMLLTFQPNAKGRPLVSSLNIPLKRYVTLTEEIVAARKIKKIGVVATNIGAAEAYIELVRPALPEIAYQEMVANDAVDFKSTVTKIRARPVDAILLLLSPEQSLIFAEAAAAQRFRAHLISGDLLADEALRLKIVKLMGGVTYMYGKVNGDFKRAYATRFGNTSYFFESASGYTFGQIVAALKDSLTARPAEIIAKIASLQIAEAPVGPVKFTYSEEYGLHSELSPTAYTEEAAD